MLRFPHSDFGILRKNIWGQAPFRRNKVFFSSCDSFTCYVETSMLLLVMLYEKHQAATKPGRDPAQRNSSWPCCQSGCCRGGLFTSPSSLPAEATLSSSLLQGSLLTRCRHVWEACRTTGHKCTSSFNWKKRSPSSGNDIGSDAKRRVPYTTSEVLSWASHSSEFFFMCFSKGIKMFTLTIWTSQVTGSTHKKTEKIKNI